MCTPVLDSGEHLEAGRSICWLGLCRLLHIPIYTLGNIPGLVSVQGPAGILLQGWEAASLHFEPIRSMC